MKTLFFSVLIFFVGTTFCLSQSISSKNHNKTSFGIYAQVNHFQANDGFLGETYLFSTDAIKKYIH